MAHICSDIRFIYNVADNSVRYLKAASWEKPLGSNPKYTIGCDSQYYWPVILTKNLRLEAVSNTEKYLHDLRPILEDETGKKVATWFKEWRMGQFSGFAIYTRETNRFVGYCALSKTEEAGVANLTYEVIPSEIEHQAEAVKALILYATTLGKEGIYLRGKPFTKLIIPPGSQEKLGSIRPSFS